MYLHIILEWYFCNKLSVWLDVSVACPSDEAVTLSVMYLSVGSMQEH